ncbi:MAG: serine hydrolase [Patescibacteria group bacterium]|jgi:predicted alpha/beta hydrolase family esterase|nr:serine hydrolase [Patescibacteria group bacterium]
MIRKIVIIHGWKDNPNGGWLGWFASQLRHEGYEVVNPQMPRDTIPDIDNWVDIVNNVVGELDHYTILIGHSLGTFVLLRYLERYEGIEKALALVLVAGFLNPKIDKANDYFLPTPDVEKVKKHVESIYHIYSDDDKMVSTDRSIELADKLGGEQICLEGKGHFTAKEISELPELLDIIKNI